MRFPLLAVLILAAVVGAPAQSPLQIKMYTSPPDGISVTSTLVYGDKDAILVDPSFCSVRRTRSRPWCSRASAT